MRAKYRIKFETGLYPSYVLQERVFLFFWKSCYFSGLLSYAEEHLKLISEPVKLYDKHGSLLEDHK